MAETENNTTSTRSRSNTTTQENNNDSHDSVRVAVRIRPQMPREIEEGAQTCINVPDRNIPQIQVDQSDRAYTYDYAYDADLGQREIYENSVNQLVNGCFDGFNATVLAYGQTGAGKTFTMGTGFQHQRIDFSDDDNTVGLVPRALKRIFNINEDKNENLDSSDPKITDFSMKISFMELYNEQIIDLLSNQDRSKES